jgi:hypothetical protein
MEDHTFSRRKFITKYLTAGAVLGGALAVLSAEALAQTKPKAKQTPKKGAKPTAKKSPAKAAAPDPCDDYTGIPASELEKRRKFAYVTQSPIPDSHCDNCALHAPTYEGKKGCMGCALFKGPVRPTAYCVYWAAIPAN